MLIDMSRVYRQSNLENLDQAFTVAERDLGVTRLLDPEGTGWGELEGPSAEPHPSPAWSPPPDPLPPRRRGCGTAR